MKTLDRYGNSVKPTDPNRMLWYSAGCGYWTDDWDRVTPKENDQGFSIPRCPECHRPGFETEADKWERGAAEHDAAEPGYAAFLNANKEKCLRAEGGFLAAWAKHKETGRRVERSDADEVTRLRAVIRDFLEAWDGVADVEKMENAVLAARKAIGAMWAGGK